jgi:hypothetical protein
LRDEGWHHVHYIECEKEDPIGTTKTVGGTSTFKEVYVPRLQVDAIGKLPTERRFTMYSSTLACACMECFYAFNSPNCNHRDLRQVQQHSLKLLTTTTSSAQRPRQQENPTVTLAVDGALKRLCTKFGRTKMLKKDLKEVIIGVLSLPPLTAKQRSGKKKYLVKLAFEAAFEGETLDVEDSAATEETVNEPIKDDLFYTDDQEDFYEEEERPSRDERTDIEDSGAECSQGCLTGTV